MKMYLAAADTQFQTDSLFDMQFGLLNGERERSLGYIHNLHCKRENVHQQKGKRIANCHMKKPNE
jgi:hypothetical protein